MRNWQLMRNVGELLDLMADWVPGEAARRRGRQTPRSSM
jgi:hypothetical protein